MTWLEKLKPTKGAVYVKGNALPESDYETATGRQLYTITAIRQAYDAGWQAAPPQRPWVGLTDEEIWGVVSRIGTSDSDVNPYQTIKDARAIEAKLKEKNT